MPIIKTRVFLRIVDAGNLESAIVAVESEVNTFLATFNTVTDVVGIDYHTGPASKYGERMLYTVTIAYLETP